MKRCNWIRAVAAFAIAVVVLSASSGSRAATSDYSDLWWNPAQSGWGMQLVQSGDVLFATLYVYDVQGRPTFYAATLGPAAATAYSGDLYVASGPWFGAGAFPPADVVARKVGAFTFSPITATLATLQYTVDGVSVTQQVQRQTLRVDNYGGHYVATVHRVTTSCGDTGLVGEHVDRYDVNISQSGSQLTMDWSGPALFSCRFSGTFDQAGRFGEIATGYDCTSTESGNMSFGELTLRSGMMAGRFQGHGLNNGCDHRGRIVGLQPQ